MGSAVFYRLITVTDRQTETPRYSVTNSRPHLRVRIVLRCGIIF